VVVYHGCKCKLACDQRAFTSDIKVWKCRKKQESRVMYTCQLSMPSSALNSK